MAFRNQKPPAAVEPPTVEGKPVVAVDVPKDPEADRVDAAADAAYVAALNEGRSAASAVRLAEEAAAAEAAKPPPPPKAKLAEPAADHSVVSLGVDGKPSAPGGAIAFKVIVNAQGCVPLRALKAIDSGVQVGELFGESPEFAIRLIQRKAAAPVIDDGVEFLGSR